MDVLPLLSDSSDLLNNPYSLWQRTFGSEDQDTTLSPKEQKEKEINQAKAKAEAMKVPVLELPSPEKLQCRKTVLDHQ